MKFLYFESEIGEKLNKAIFPGYQIGEEFDDSEFVLEIINGDLKFDVKNMNTPSNIPNVNSLKYTYQYMENEYIKENGKNIIKNIEIQYEHIEFRKIGDNTILRLISKNESDVNKLINSEKNKKLIKKFNDFGFKF